MQSVPRASGDAYGVERVNNEFGLSYGEITEENGKKLTATEEKLV